jgi:hypothetical protein
MIVSRNEIETTCQRAALGVGLAHGLAEDAAAIAAWLAADGEDVAAIMLAALSSVDENGFPVPCFIHDERVWRSAEQVIVPALVAGPCATDLLRAEPGAVIQICRTDEPRVIAAALALAGLDAAEVPLERGQSMRLTARPCARPPPRPLAEGFTVADAVWRELLKLAARTYVPASEQSRLKGAGAGLSDND